MTMRFGDCKTVRPVPVSLLALVCHPGSRTGNPIVMHLSLDR
jgi:hypothetical protein